MIEISGLCKTFKSDEGTVQALNDVSITIEDGDIFGIIGMSGAGKSTLVRCINLLERPDQGTVRIDGTDMSSLTEKQLRLQRKGIAMVFQNFNLLMQRNCLDNICFPLLLNGVSRQDARKRAEELLEIVGLSDKALAYPAQLSGGQQQRIAIARALANNPKVLLCDEATSALDPNTTNSILDLISDINRRYGITVVVITHQMSVVEKICNHVAIMDNGMVVEQGEVGQVFSRPKSKAARSLVFPQSDPDSVIATEENQQLIRVVFNGASITREPVIAKMATERGIMANITYASTRNINTRVYGSMLLAIDEDRIKDAVAYLEKIEGIVVQEVGRDE